MSNYRQDYNTSLVGIIGVFTIGLIGIVIPTVILLQHFAGLDTIAWLESIWWGSFPVRLLDSDYRTGLGVAFTVLATLVGLFNFWRYQMSLYYQRHGEGGGGSGLPVIGSFFLLGAVAVMPGSVFWGNAFLVLYAIDTDGFFWFSVVLLGEWWETGRLPR